ncbi:hypothetical protein H6A66_12045 [Bacteroides caecigallinarum]|uniref:hypothetical protein n=1 Tax=Bacteroides caecigallinarum TaxID=1411144 RepID=UPI00195B107D|nr:hypothetical protein [Bacteroides caecigallinarum]MBM6865897.1 hypothetical protein [Bacteroides caecigallinarum]
MTILQKPETINLSGNLADFILSSSSVVSFVLKQDSRVLFVGNYTPNDNQRIEIDVKEIIEADLKAVFSDSSEPYEQPELAKTYTAEIAEQTHTFTVIKAGVDRLATSAANFLKANWLTWQPQVKKVTYYLPESLTFYSVEASVVKVKAYFQQPSGEYTEEIKQLLSIVAGKAYTVPVQYAVIAGKFESRLPAFYDVWFETTAGERLSYIQRYVPSAMMSEDEQWVVFENSLGGFDTFRAYGQQSLTADHEHQLAEINEITDEYNVDTTREFQKNTGHLTDHERKWLLDFFPSRQKYLYSSNYLRRIVVTEDDTSYTAGELPSSYTFNYRFADAKPFLNLQRVEELPTDLSISIPDLSSFTIPPRLVEFPSQNLTEGVMFPVQNPYSESWATTTIGAILSYIMNKIIEIGGDGTGGVGHSHGNFDVLKSLEYIDGYLTHNGQKIKAGYADKAGELDEGIMKKFIRRDIPDSALELITFLKGLLIGENGSGITVLEDGTSQAVVDRLYVKIKAVFDELEVKKRTQVGGEQILSPAGMKCIRVEELVDAYRCYFLAEADGVSIDNDFTVGQLAMAKECNIKEGTSQNVSNRYYWRLVTGVGSDYIDLSKTYCDSGSDIPAEGDDIVGFGHKTDKSRQGAILLSSVDEHAPAIIFYQGIDSYSLIDKDVISLYYDKSTGKAHLKVYGDFYVGTRDRSSYFKFTEAEGGEFKGKVIIGPGSSGWENMQGLPEKIQEITNAAAAAKDAADKAAEDAASASEEASQASGRLDEWADDSVISPAEKTALKQELANLQSEYDTIIINADKYSVDASGYSTAWAAYKTELEYHSADEPESISVRASFKTAQTLFYEEREKLLVNIAAAAKEYSDKLFGSISVGAENLLLNTGFTGNYRSTSLSSSTKLNSGTDMYSARLEHWEGTGTVVEDNSSRSKYACQVGSIAQNVQLISGEHYVISYKAKGTSLSVSCGNFSETVNLTSDYKRYTHKLEYINGNIFMMAGSATVCEVKLERGTVSTDWCPSLLDRNDVAAEFREYWYLKDALQGNTDILGGLTLTSMVMLGQWADGVLKKVNAGVSGIYNDDQDVAFWAGGTLEGAIKTVQRLLEGDVPTDDEWRTMAKFVATHGGDVFMRGFIFALGGYFRGMIDLGNGTTRLNADGTGWIGKDSGGKRFIEIGKNLLKVNGTLNAESGSVIGGLKVTAKGALYGQTAIFSSIPAGIFVGSMFPEPERIKSFVKDNIDKSNVFHLMFNGANTGTYDVLLPNLDDLRSVYPELVYSGYSFDLTFFVPRTYLIINDQVTTNDAVFKIKADSGTAIYNNNGGVMSEISISKGDVLELYCTIVGSLKQIVDGGSAFIEYNVEYYIKNLRQ